MRPPREPYREKGFRPLLIGGVVKLLWWQAPGLTVGRAVKYATHQAPQRSECDRRLPSVIQRRVAGSRRVLGSSRPTQYILSP